jgi:hypothetical protein
VRLGSVRVRRYVREESMLNALRDLIRAVMTVAEALA